MQADIHLTLEEFIEALRAYCLEKTGYASKTICIESYNKVMIYIAEDGMVNCEEFKHQSNLGGRHA